MPPPRKISPADLIALALEHRAQAERSTCPADQREFHRVADIYMVLASIDRPAPVSDCDPHATDRRNGKAAI